MLISRTANRYSVSWLQSEDKIFSGVLLKADFEFRMAQKFASSQRWGRSICLQKKTGHPSSPQRVSLKFPGYSLTPIISRSNPSKCSKATPQIPQQISPFQETQSEIPRTTHTTRVRPHH
ncbi:hypothetical protein T265_03472 [Opisthorchis viverrini]|uniref:Uncharacterized protein n=1 Tax=Opisthorchis viverrini TaxID=6198 RepID=A0A075AHJ4_OPIVI|nr:hypothetical protein T265_03472 [Opisthorchis viverrini]KER29989.1 hypothetical protein T265_03472 [Opisthorchis viverrini]